MKNVIKLFFCLLIISSCQTPKSTSPTQDEIINSNLFLEGRSTTPSTKSDNGGYRYIIPESHNMDNVSQHLATELAMTHFQYQYDYEGGITACLNKIDQLTTSDINHTPNPTDDIQLMLWSYSMMDLYIKHHPDTEAAAQVLTMLIEQADPVEWLILTEALRVGKEELMDQGMYETMRTELKKRIIEYQALNPHDEALSEEDLLSLDHKATAALDIIKRM